MNIFGIGLPEMIVILGVALLIFGPKKLPEIGRSLGQAINSFKEGARELENEFKREAKHLEESPKTSKYEPEPEPDKEVVNVSSQADAAPKS